MKKQAKWTYAQQAELIVAQRETITLQQRQLLLQEVVFGKLHDFIGQLNEQMQSSRKDAKALVQQREG